MDVSLDALRAVLRRGFEAEDLDYKSTWNPTARREVLELAKDIAAMEALPEGGYLVVGADDEGRSSGVFHVPDRSVFDEQQIRARFAAALGEPLSLNIALHRLDGHPYLLVGVNPHPDGFRVMSRPGAHSDDRGRQRNVWNESDVFVRRGTSSVRWNQHDVRNIFERIVAVRKEAWRAEALSLVRSPSRTDRAVTDLDPEMPPALFAECALELVRLDDRVGLDVAIRKLISGATRELAGTIDDDEAASISLGQYLVRLAAVGALAARYELEATLRAVVQGFRSIYGALDEDYTEIPRRFALGHEQVLRFAYALGAALVHDERWSAIRDLSVVTPEATYGGYWKSLLRKAEVMSARAEVGRGSEGREPPALIERAKPAAIALFELIDVDVEAAQLTSNLVQFDVYRGIATTDPSDELEKVGAYTNFAFYSRRRAEPAFLKVYEDEHARAELFSGTLEELRIVYTRMDEQARREGWARDGWSGFSSAPLRQFVYGEP